jgi:hypothetical protein
MKFSDSATTSGGYIGYTTEDMSFWTNATERMRIDSSGNVGIGTASAYSGAKLSVNGSIVQANGSQHVIGTYGTSGLQLIGTAGGDNVIGTMGSSEPLIFRTVSAERMRIDSSGNLLVGQTTANSFNLTSGFGFDVRQTYGLGVAVQDNPTAIFNRTNTDGDIVQFRKNGSTVGSIGSSAAGGGGFRLTNQGTEFSILLNGGSPSTSSITYVQSNLLPYDDNYSNLGSGSERWKDGHFSGTVNAANFNTTSDATLKTNVETLSGSLDAVKSLRGVSFDWLENGGSEVGVIAQEVEAVLPDVVSTNDQGIKSVKYGNMVALLIEAMKEQQAQIDELKAKLGE